MVTGVLMLLSLHYRQQSYVVICITEKSKRSGLASTYIDEAARSNRMHAVWQHIWDQTPAI